MQSAARPTIWPIGKISSDTFQRSIQPYLGRADCSVLVGPRAGVDSGIIDLGNGKVMGVTTDPLYIEPAFGWELAAWFAVHILASDAATSGLRPAYLTVDLNLPPSMSDVDLDALWRAVSATCDELDVAVVTGHTARYDGCSFPIIGGATMLSVGTRDAYVVPAMACPGDAVIVTKGAAIETTGIFGVLCGAAIEEAYGVAVAADARALFHSMSVVRDAQIAVSVGVRDCGVTCMHDATERGVWGGLVEIAEAAGTGLMVDEHAIPIRPESLAVCELFGIDPYSTSSEGTLLLTCIPRAADAVIDRLGAAGIHAAEIGHLTPADEGILVVRDDLVRDLAMPVADPFWPALTNALREERRG